MSIRNDLQSLIKSIYQWAGRPTKDGAKDLRILAADLDLKYFEEKDPTKMTKEEIEKFEQEQVESSNIFRIAARVKNLARSNGGALTPVGEMMCNQYIHVLKDLYDFADTLEDNRKEDLCSLIRRHENMPAKLLEATKSKK